MVNKFVILLYLVVITSLVSLILYPPSPPLSPLSQVSPPTYSSQSKSYFVLGFVPYWNLKKITPESSNTITHFGYFALHLDGAGEVQTHVNRRELEPGYHNYTRLLQNLPSTPLILTFMQADQDSLEALLGSSASRSNAVNTIVTRLQESKASGVNIDFEPVGETPKALRSSYTLFIKELKSRLLSIEAPLLTISLYPSAGSRPRLWDLKKLADDVDYFVVMTYDYTMPRSVTSGPNSPLRDAGGVFEHNIVKNIAEISALVPAEKLLLGIPLYGYEWDTVDNSRYSPTLGRGVTASFERIQKMINDRTLELVWDRNSLTAYGIATDSGRTSQIYFDNEVSLRLKLNFVKDAGLGGIAIWALGYDQGVTWLWPEIAKLNE